MSTRTTNLGLFKYDTVNDSELPFSIDDALNDNWDILDETAADLNNKVDKSDLQEVQCVVETYQNGSSWYRVYSDGFCIQGGACTSGTAIQYLKTFADTNYSLTVTRSAKSTTGFTPSATGDWLACGYLATENA